MSLDKLLSDIKDRINKKNIFELRQVARALGVPQPTDGKKDKIIDGIIALADGSASPVPRSKKGAPPKSNEYDKQLVEDIEKCRMYFLAERSGAGVESNIITLSDGTETEQSCAGILDRGDKYYFLRTQGCNISLGEDVFVHDTFIEKYSLRIGDLIEGVCRRRASDREAGLTKVTAINGISAEVRTNRGRFENLTPVYPKKLLKTATGQDDISGRIIDLFAPIGAGQRAFVAAPQSSGKTELLKKLAAGIVKNNPEVKVIVLLIDERPEDVTDFKRTVTGAQLFYTEFDESSDTHIHAVNLVSEYAKRQVEAGKDVVLIFDGITRLVHAYNAYETLSTSISSPKKLLSGAKNAEEGGSLTIISTISNNVANLSDGAAYSEIMPTANMKVVLSEELVKRRIFPAIDIKSSGTGRDDLLLSAEEISAVSVMRRKLDDGMGTEQLIDLFKTTQNNGELIKKFN